MTTSPTGSPRLFVPVDTTKIGDELGYRPKVSFADGLAASVAWYRDNRQWWEPAKPYAAALAS